MTPRIYPIGARPTRCTFNSGNLQCAFPATWIYCTDNDPYLALCTYHLVVLRRLAESHTASPGKNFSNPPRESRIETRETEKPQQVAPIPESDNMEPPMPPVTRKEFVRFWIEHGASGSILHSSEHGKVGAVEPCGLGLRARLIHEAKMRHPRWCSEIGTIQTSRTHFIEYRKDGTFQAYHVA